MRILMLLIATAGFCSCTESTQSGNPEAVTGTGYSIGNPYDWEQSRDVMGMDLILLSPQESDADQFRENVNVTVEKLPASMSHQDYLDASIANIKKIISLKGEFTYEPTSINGVSGYVAHIRHRMGVLDLALDSYVVIKDGTSYVISCTAMEDEYKSYSEKFSKIVSTFTVE